MKARKGHDWRWPTRDVEPLHHEARRAKPPPWTHYTLMDTGKARPEWVPDTTAGTMLLQSQARG